MAKRTAAPKAVGAVPPAKTATPKSQFFVRELEGEEPLSRATAEQLLDIAYKIVALKPWDDLDETQLIFVRHPESDEPDTCSVMGSVFSLYGITAYLGLEGYRHFVQMQEARSVSPTLFFENNRSLRMGYEDSRDLTPADRDLLKETGVLKKGARHALRFESYRPGYLGWYLSEPEARRLRWNLHGLHVVLSAMKRQPDFDFWAIPGTYPGVSIIDGPNGLQAELAATKEPELPESVEEEGVVDAIDLAAIAGLKIRSNLILQSGFFILPMPIGGKHQRKMCARLALAADLKSGFVYPPNLQEPSAPAVKMVVNQTVDAIRLSGALPAEIQVGEQRFATALAPFNREFGVRIRVKSPLVALDEVVESMSQMF